MPNESRYNKIFDNALVNFDEVTKKFFKSVDDSFGNLQTPEPPHQKKENPKRFFPFDEQGFM